MKNTQNLTPDEVDKLTQLLKKLRPGFLPYQLFEEVARIIALPIIEVVPLKVNTRGKIEVLLLEREPDDPIWPGMLHTPGTVVRADDLHSSNMESFSRIIEEELAGLSTSRPHFVKSIFHKSKRGSEQAQIFWVEVLEEPRKGKFYPVEDLPESVIESQRTFISAAARSFDLSKPKASLLNSY